MGWVSGVVVFVLLWWIVLFLVLPWGVARHRLPDGTPDRPRLPRAFAITTVLAGVLWIIVFEVISSGGISFHDMARDRMHQLGIERPGE